MHTLTSWEIPSLENFAKHSTQNSVDANLFQKPSQQWLQVVCESQTNAESYPLLQYNFQLARSTITKIIPKVCQAMRDEYQAEIVVDPNTPQGWL